MLWRRDRDCFVTIKTRNREIMDGFGGRELILTVAEQLFSSDSSDSDSDTELLYELFSVAASQLQKNRKPRRPDNTTDILNTYVGDDFKEYFRLTRETFEHVLSEIGDSLKAASLKGQAPISPDKQLLLSLWVFSTSDSYSAVSERFQIGKSTSIVCCQKVMAALCNIAPDVIRWPNAKESQEIRRGFEIISGFPGAIGAVDATHIQIRTPRVNNQAYYANKMGKHSVILQGVCNHRAEFTHCYAGQTGSISDSRVLEKSEVFSFAENDRESRFPNNSHLLGDSAYPCTSWLMVPFEDNGLLTQRQTNYNSCLATARCTVERAFGLLKGRWRRLQYLDMHNTHCIPQFIIACCVLHNVCLTRSDELDEVYSDDVDDDDDDDEESTVLSDADGTQKRIDVMSGMRMRYHMSDVLNS